MHLGGEKELQKAYKEIDREIIPVITKICEEQQYHLIIVSDHGSKKTHKKFNINTFLKKKGYVTIDEPAYDITRLVQKVIEFLPITIVRMLQSGKKVANPPKSKGSHTRTKKQCQPGKSILFGKFYVIEGTISP